MKSRELFKIKLENYRPLLWYGDTVFGRYESIKNLLGSQFDRKFANVLAEPSVMDGENGVRYGVWYAENVEEYRSFDKLAPEEQQQAANQLSEILEKVTAFADQLLQSGEASHKQMGEILHLAFRVPGYESIYWGNGQVILVLWGFVSDELSKKSFSLRDALSRFRPQVTPPESQTKVTPPPVPKTGTTGITEDEKKTVVTPPPIPEINKNVGEYEKDRKITDETTTVTEDVKVKKESRWKLWWRKWWKRLLWILLALLLLLLLFFLLNNSRCGDSTRRDQITHISMDPLPERDQDRSGDRNRQNPVPPTRREQIPVTPLPVDRNAVRPMPGDTLQRPIVGNRLNVIINRDNTIEEFLEDFNARYTDQAQVVYCDTLANLLQVQFTTDDIVVWKERLQKLTGVRMVFTESVFGAEVIPDEPGFKDTDESYYFKLIRAFQGWDVTMGREDVVVAVIDNAFDLEHEELKGQCVNPWNIMTNSPDVNTYGGTQRHGTHVASLVVGAINGVGVSGIAPGCKVMPIQVGVEDGSMPTSAIIKGFLYALKQGVQVISISIGSNPREGTDRLPWDVQEQIGRTTFVEEGMFWNELYAYAEECGVLVVECAGNENILTVVDPMKRSDKVLYVGAVGVNAEPAWFSNFGKYVSICAPGMSIFNAIPDNKYDFLQGTSMSTPIVAGAAALLFSLGDDVKFTEVKEALVKTAIPLPGNGVRKQIGNLLQVDKAIAYLQKNNPLLADPCTRKIDSLQREIERLKKLLNQH
ncbi:MAG TPA: S8 family serine peptidase [Candidatus Butyricimonas faecavium]|nr:S8 family serine peptidase [Candidatus Butyricimonas faecavium]